MVLTNTASAVTEMKSEANSYIFEAGRQLEQQYDVNDLGPLDDIRVDAMLDINDAESEMVAAYRKNQEAVEKGPGMHIIEGETSELTAEEQSDMAGDAMDHLSNAADLLSSGMQSYDELVREVEEEQDTSLPGVKAKLGAAEQVYAEALEEMSYGIAETKRGLAAPQEEMVGYNPIFDEGM